MRLRSANCWSRACNCETGHGHVEDRLQALGLDAFDDIGADTGPDRLAHHIRVVFVGEHHDGAWLVATDQHHLFQHIAAGGFGVDQDHIRAYAFDPCVQIDGQPRFVDDIETGLDQGGPEPSDFFCGIVDQQDTQHVQASGQ